MTSWPLILSTPRTLGSVMTMSLKASSLRTWRARVWRTHDAVGIFAGVDGDVEGADGEVAGEVGDGGDLGVGDDVDGAVAVAELGDAEGEVFDGALEAGDLDGVADVVLVFDEDEDAVEHVFEDGLGAEGRCRGR